MESCFDLSAMSHALPLQATTASRAYLSPGDDKEMPRSSPISACSAEILGLIADCTHEDAIRDFRGTNQAFAQASIRAYARMLRARHFTMTEISLRKLLQISQHAIFAKYLTGVKINSFDIYKDQEMFMSEANEQDKKFFDDRLDFVRGKGDLQMLEQICSALAPVNGGRLAIEIFEGSWHPASPDRGPELYEEVHITARVLVLLTDAVRAAGCTISELQLRLREFGMDAVLKGALRYTMLERYITLRPDLSLKVSQAFPELTAGILKSVLKSHPAFEATMGNRILSNHDFNKDPPRSVISLPSPEHLYLQRLSLGPKWWTWSSVISIDFYNLEMCYRFATTISRLRTISLSHCEILSSEFMMLIRRHEKTLRELELHDVALPHSQKWSQTLGSLGYLNDLESLSISQLVVANPDPETLENCPMNDDDVTECACTCEYDCCEVVLGKRHTWVGVDEVQAGIARTVKRLDALEKMPHYCLEVEIEDEDFMPIGPVRTIWNDNSHLPLLEQPAFEAYNQASVAEHGGAGDRGDDDAEYYDNDDIDVQDQAYDQN